eukprot:TRINITY_DN17410_c0_g1_i2.p2 TRINITY_DN17410_c0_g1~~TRINITY_DN17410_c0_g1_i2.p2  ORF type:complete len:342 (+),score=127.51 TRINITY_DN17410_c0_g1_i2:69-1028(+)
MGTPPQLASQAGPAPSAPPPELSPSSFRVLHTIGEGAFSVVRLAERGKERWALKFTRKPTGRGPAAGDARAAVVRELGFLRSLPPHPHVVGCAGYFTAGDEEACLVQEFAPNGDLREALSGGEPLPAEDAALVARQVAAALAHLHAHGVAHGDLKPENILFGGRGQAMLCDFGSAVLIEAAEAEEGAERYQGTPQYQAPEVIERGRRGAAADLWALGCVALELLWGAPAFAAPSEYLVMRRVLQGDPGWDAAPPLSDTAGDLLRQRLLVADPSARGTAAGALLHPWLAAHERTDPGQSEFEYSRICFPDADQDCGAGSQ